MAEVQLLSRSELEDIVMFLVRTNWLLIAQNASLKEANDALQAKIVEMEKKVARLEHQLGQNSNNSSRPPSANPHKKPSVPAKKPDGTEVRRGPKFGHDGHTRHNFDRTPDHINRITLTNCPLCQHALDGPKEKLTITQQVAELVPNPVEVTEYQIMGYYCEHCKAVVRGDLPDNIQPGEMYGPRLKSFIALMNGWANLSFEKTQTLLTDIFRIPISQGSINNILEEVGQALEPVMAEVKSFLSTLPFIHVDESTWRINGKKAWVWVFANPLVTYLYVCYSRSHEVIKEVLGAKYHGILISDAFSAYQKFEAWLKQTCLAHIIRRLQGCIESVYYKEDRDFGLKVQPLIKSLFHIRNLFLSNQITDTERVNQSTAVIEEIRKHVSEAPETVVVARGLLTQFKKHWDDFWTFVHHPEIPLDNNEGERSLRSMIVHRKVSGGSRSDDGAKITATLFSVFGTCRKQGLLPLEVIRMALLARRNPLIARPTLIPGRGG